MTRPQGASERFVARLPQELRQRLTPIYAPLIGIVPGTSSIEFGDAKGLIFTSANGVRIAADLTRRRDLPCYCVGEATTHAARQAGWQAECTGPNAEALIKALYQSQRQTRLQTPLLHLRGAHARGGVAARLMAMGCPTHEQVIYDQPLLPMLGETRQLLADRDPILVPLFSPRTARQFADQYSGSARLYIAALSEAVADPIKSLKKCTIYTALTPKASAVIQLIGQLADDAERVESRRSAQ